MLVEPMVNDTLKGFDESLKGWTDARLVSADEIRTMTMFLLYLVNLADHYDWVYRGHSWKESEYLGCLVVKAIVDGVPSVVFTNAKTPIASMRIFLRKMEGNFLEWVPDKYA